MYIYVLKPRRLLIGDAVEAAFSVDNVRSAGGMKKREEKRWIRGKIVLNWKCRKFKWKKKIKH